MKVVIDKKAHIYRYLKNGHKLNEGLGTSDDWGPKDKEVEKLKKTNSYILSPIELFYPLSKSSLVIERDDGIFSMIAAIVPRDSNCFNYASKYLRDSLTETGFRFEQTTCALSGYIFDQKNQTRVSILEDSDNDLREVSFGCNGAISRNFGDYQMFRRNLNELEFMLSKTINAIYYPLVTLGQITIPDATLHFVPTC